MTSPDDTTIGQYRLLRLLGRGGMGEVHLAHDTKLDRDVALKLLPEELADDAERRTRFLREARAAAALNHPNITTIHDVGRFDGRDYIAQEYLDGQSLSDMLLARTLPVDELAELAVPLADALTYAHEKGVIHRDLKASNVMVTERGHPKLLDFGLAKVIHDASATNSGQSTTLTIQGSIFGTPTAMSPEQALGRTVDVRSDIFSFGSLLYEMAAGKPPFLGTTVQETLDKVVHEPPESLGRLRRDLPADFVAIVEKAHRKQPDERYQRMEDLAADLRHFKRATDSGLMPAVTPRTTPSRVPMLGPGVLVLAVAALLLWKPWSTTADDDATPAGATDVTPRFAAVMYVENLTDPDDSEHLATMLAHLLTTELSSTRGLDMLSQQRLFETARRLGREDGNVDKAIASEVANLAGVGTMLLGRLSQVGGKLLATVSMVDAESGAEIASARADGRGESDLFEMVASLGEQVRIALTGRTGSSASPEQQLTTSIEAYRFFVQARGAMSANDFQAASDLLTEAVNLDPAFALANFWLGITLQWGFGTLDEATLAMERAMVHPERLPAEIKPVARAALLHISGQYGESLDILQRVLVQSPDNLVASYLLGEIRLHSSVHGDAGESARLFGRTLEIDSGFTMVRDHLAAALVFAGDADEALALIDTWERDDEQPLTRLRRNTASRMGQLELAMELTAALVPNTRGGGRQPPLLDLDADRQWLAEMDDQLLDDPEAAGAIRSHAAAPRLIRLGRFDEALDQLPAMQRLAPGPAYDWETNCWAAARHDEAFLHELSGDLTAARAAANRALDAQPLAYRNLYLGALLAARDSDLPTARQLAGRLDALVEQGLGAMAPLYRDAAWAEIAAANGQPDEARRLYRRAIGRDAFMHDWWTDNRSFGPVLRDGLARACLAAGDNDEARQALQALRDARDEWAGYSVLHAVRALYTLGVLELDAGDVEPGRANLERFLEHWGEADWELGEVADARERLAGL